MKDEQHYNIEAEQQLLGALLLDNARADLVRGILKAEHFFDPAHGALYAEILKDVDDGKRSSPVTLKSRWDGVPGSDDLGGSAYLVRLAGASISADYCKDYADIIVDEAGKRSLLTAIAKANEKMGAGQSASKVIRELDREVGAINVEAKGKPISITRAATSALERLYNASEGGTTGGVPTGREALSQRLGGFFRQDLIILAARPSMGKTALATATALAVARAGHPVAFVSREMSEESLMHRFMSEITGIPYFRFRRPEQLSDDDFILMKDAAVELASLPIQIIPDSAESLDEIRSGCRTVKRMYGDLGLVVVDYLQLIEAEGRQQSEKIGNVSKGLKSMAKQLDAPVIALSQLSRRVEDRDDKRPMLSDLRDSGQIEQDADVVLFVYRDHYYLSRTKPKGIEEQVDWEAELTRTENQMEIITAKQRMGSTGRDIIGCDVKVNRFWDIGHTDDTEEMDF